MKRRCQPPRSGREISRTSTEPTSSTSSKSLFANYAKKPQRPNVTTCTAPRKPPTQRPAWHHLIPVPFNPLEPDLPRHRCRFSTKASRGVVRVLYLAALVDC